MKKKLKYILIILSILIICTVLIILDSYINIDISHYDIKSNKINQKYNNYKIMLLTDLHNRDITKKLLRIVNEENPNLIVMSGDMINEKVDGYDNFFNLCEKIKDKTIYYVFGNHEENMSNEKQTEFITKLKEKTNVILLNNDKIELDDNFTIYGFSHQVKYYLASTKEKIDSRYIEEKIGKIDKNKFNLLISHDPLLYDLYNEYGFDVVLSGHLHGGIINIPFIGGLLSPDFTFFPKYYKGINKIGNTNIVISRGLGYGYMIPIRVLNRGEVVIINLMKNE